jgi:preprotein translocase SecF subunit
VVVFDRIREYSQIFKTEAYDLVVNKSINSTLSRTIVTSGTTLIVVMVLFLTGGEVLRGFAFALIVGIFVGTYSSIFVAAPVVLELRNRARK